MMSRQQAQGAPQQLTRMGVSLWLDGWDRRELTSVEFKRLSRDCEITGVTMGPADLGSALLAPGDWYARQREDGGSRTGDSSAALRELDISDVCGACDQLRPISDATDGVNGYAAIEVDARFADDAAATVADAHNLTRVIDRPNLLVTIPATHSGLAAIKSCVSDGIQVNATLIFGLRRYAQVIDAFMDGLERRRAAGGDVHRITSVASLPLWQMDAEVNRRLTEPVARVSLHGRVAVANARLAFHLLQQSMTLPRWSSLAADGARPQRLLLAGAATLPETHYVTALAIQDVILSVPAATLTALERIDDLTAIWTGEELDARAVLDALGRAGIEYDELVVMLERTGVQTRMSAWEAAVDA
jgi:transaldolase